jgi:glycine/D-amino acid oxidase-like deaminating enzyme/nitrite reductase/ring-hydroxylating ferredoxin subunit
MNQKDRTESLWEHVELPKFPLLDHDHDTDTVIVGGGITGVSIAYQMAKRGHSVTLVEAFRLGSGQTGRTTAHLTCQLEEQFIDLLGQDKDTIRTFFEAHRKAIDVIEEIITKENISCDFKRLDGFLFKGRNFDEEKLRREQDAAKKLGADLDYVSQVPFLSGPVSGLRFPRQGQFHPLKYLNGLVRVLKDLGVEIFEGTHVTDMRQEDRKTWTLLTDTGKKITAKNLVVATNTPVNNRFYIHTKQYAYRTYAMSFKFERSHKEDVLLWDTEDPYHYIRFYEDTIIIGGEDHRTGQAPERDPFIELERWSRNKFSFLGEVKEKWSGQIFEPMDQIAFIGRNPGLEKNVYISTGESGIGMTSATIASLIIPDLIDRGSHPWEKVFEPSRSPAKGLRDFVQENLNVAYQYKDWITPPQVHEPEEIPVDKGSLLQEGITKSCVYHDGTDHFEKKSAICTHLGGIVHWNDIEKTWDCPCHGSRFNTKGKVIEGPALSDLQEK